jgi:hypothetical protein
MKIKAPVYNSWLTYIGVGAMTIIGVLFFIASAFELVPIDPPEAQLPIVFFSFAWVIFISWLGYLFLRIPTVINVVDGRHIVFLSPLLTISIEATGIIELTCDSDGDWVLYHTQGKIDLRYFKHDGIKKFTTWLLGENSKAKVPIDL